VLLTPQPLSALTIEDEPSFRHVGLYHDLKKALLDDGFRFLIPAKGRVLPWSRALFLNLAFWDAAAPNDVLAGPTIAADVVAHAAWHHLARRALGGAAPSAEALFLGESIASAFDLYLVGRLLGHAPDSSFLETQVPAMADAAEDAGLDGDAFEALLGEISEAPERAFEDLRALLFDACVALLPTRNVEDAANALAVLDARRFGPLLHHYELSNWVLFARAHTSELGPDPAVRAVDRALRAAPDPVAWLEHTWLRGAAASAMR
jgi:hypothetical protein